MAYNHDIALSPCLAHRPADDRLVVLLADVADQPVDTHDNVFRRLAAGTAVAPDIPIFIEAGGTAGGADLWRRHSLIVAVVPLDNIGRDGDARVRAWYGVRRGEGI